MCKKTYLIKFMVMGLLLLTIYEDVSLSDSDTHIATIFDFDMTVNLGKPNSTFIHFDTIIYVDDDAVGLNNGSSWTHAYIYLQDALATAVSGDEIWVATGTYTPDRSLADPFGGDREATFQLINGVAIYGGFAGIEDSATFDLADRDFETNKTILSGDLAGDDPVFADPWELLDHPSMFENSLHVVTGSGTDRTAVLDGFTITKGNANRPYAPNCFGGGMYNDSGSPTINSCAFSWNSAPGVPEPNTIIAGGGGMFNGNNSSPLLTDCKFANNASFVFWFSDFGVGGGILNMDSSLILISCTFTNNIANLGNHIYSYQTDLTIADSAFNFADMSFGTNSILRFVGTGPICTVQFHFRSLTLSGANNLCRL